MKERTIKEKIILSGRGIHSGNKAKITLYPKEEGGIIFVKDQEEIPAIFSLVKSQEREIVLSKNGVSVRGVEHLMSALYACGVDHVRVEIEGEEIPAFDGSAYPFISAIEKVGLKELKKEKRKRFINKKIFVENKGSFAFCLPAKKLKVHYIISYNHPLLFYQEYIFDGKTDFKKNIGRSRTYGFLSWKEELNKRGFALGASEKNTLIYTESGLLNKPRFKDEAVRHKILDLMGELYLLNPIPIGYYFVFRGGHLLHFQLLKEIERSKNGL
ncbi:MAG: UDP-3-O-acyl-N-acetylglucosamine deacetylase [candidate division WOR-3 bacterium]